MLSKGVNNFLELQYFKSNSASFNYKLLIIWYLALLASAWQQVTKEVWPLYTLRCAPEVAS